MSRKELECLGSQRPSLDTNPLLIAPELGKTKRRCFSLPAPDFTFGKRTVCFDGGVAEAVSFWHCQKSLSSKESGPEKDFVALNKLAAQNGLTSAHEQSLFRTCHDIRRRDKKGEFQGKTTNIPLDMTFGIATRPSTPLFDLLENRYQEKWFNERREAERKQRERINQLKLHGKVYETNASILRRYSEPVESPPLWKMKRFSKIPGTLSTFYTDKDRTRAMTYHMSDSIARKGALGQGIYNT